MFLIDDDSTFKRAHLPHAKPELGDFLFYYDDNKIALTEMHTVPILDASFGNILPAYCFGHLNGRSCFLLASSLPSSALPFVSVKMCYTTFSKDVYAAIAIGNHLSHFRKTHQYCGQCGAGTVDKLDEQALVCSHCQRVMYPKISPCVIVLITKGEEILLARSPHFTKERMSILAGFVIVGESIEQAVMREVKEEVGIEIGNLQYICSQPWPFPDTLMLGFTADYVGGELIIDHHEIEQAGWFHKNHLPPLPDRLSIARFLIDQWASVS